ncbi:unnamed protein product [Soboliphyme baturini]|uniref:Ig-like and fibronectin type-III domain-containing protein C25G4.10 n=1 Tax=Soboliphyme baturini TaxID=241478 RepID=A0A183ID80_9BILA|nr:unnamed protein product [Soboliphyme baturini]
MLRISFFGLILLSSKICCGESLSVPSVYSNEDSYIKAIGRFGTELECFVNTCLGKNQTVRWFKNNRVISQNLNVTSSSARIRHKVYFDPSKDCVGGCFGALRECPKGQKCLNSACCTCEKEEFTLLLWNLTYEDTGIYRCHLDGGNSVELDLEIVENGLFPSNNNFTFDYSECCRRENVSEACLPLCHPSRIEMHKFDPVSCENEYGKMLRCVTDAGNVSHEHCCRSHLVPPFCWDFCTGRLTELRRTHQFCTYWMHEIFDCYESHYLPFPGPPENLIVNSLNSTSVRACWRMPKIRPETVDYFTVRYQELPDFPLIPIFREFENDLMNMTPLSRNLPGNMDVTDLGAPEIVHIRSARQSIFIKMQDLQTNKTDIREYKLNEVQANDTCMTITGLKPGTQYLFYVTATNSFGTSLPTLKETVETAPSNYCF